MRVFSIIERNGGKAPLTYHQFQALIASMPPPPPAEAAISARMLNGAITPLTDDHDDRFGVPTLEELGLYIVYYIIPYLVCVTVELRDHT